MPSLFVVLAAVPWQLPPVAAWGLVATARRTRIHTRPTPMGGGLAIWLGVDRRRLPRGGFACGSPRPAARLEIVPAIGGDASEAGLVAAVGQALDAAGRRHGADAAGLADDRRGLDWRLRLAVQTSWRRCCLAWLADDPVSRLPWLTGVLCVLWIVGLVNSFNMLDNMDGLSAGVAGIAAAMLAAVMLTRPDPTTTSRSCSSRDSCW